MERRISVTEMRMLPWMGGITQLDLICNQDIRQRFGVAAIADKLREAGLRWFGHMSDDSSDHALLKQMERELLGESPPSDRPSAEEPIKETRRKTTLGRRSRNRHQRSRNESSDSSRSIYSPSSRSSENSKRTMK
ncbi:hypothetical protein ANCDUO_25119 [Ancylostoma duodenale]|uniref:Uncharacterized protein n=1 Tax=Ancylostoma duodenale TaxID=51022 RepID=A0A0C2BM64_9BILA|nr:hypothetical protein ANCDUO_25119 [Ancylostoma duodenale]